MPTVMSIADWLAMQSPSTTTSATPSAPAPAAVAPAPDFFAAERRGPYGAERDPGVDPEWARMRDALVAYHDAAGTFSGDNYREHTRDILAGSPTRKAFESNLAEWMRQHQGGRGLNSWLPDLGTGWLPELGNLDFTGLTSAALGDPNPHGLLGLQMDPIADILDTQPEDVLAYSRFGAGMLNPLVAAGLQVAPTLAYGAPFDPDEAIKRAALSAAIGYGADFAAPYASSVFDSLSAPPVDPELLADTGFSMPPAEAPAPLFSPNSYMNQPGFLNAPDLGTALAGSTSPVYGDIAEGTTYLPGMFGGYDPATGRALFDAANITGSPADLDAQDRANRDILEAGDQYQPELSITGGDLQRYARIARTGNDLLGDDGPEDAPTRPEGQPDSEYADQLARYMDLDPRAMADAGLQPGSPQYYEFIMQQADSVITQLIGNAEGDALAAQLRGKTAEEMHALQRALYVRGQMEQLMGSGFYTDPATGREEEVIAPDGGMFNPALGAYQRGLARNVDELAGMRGGDAETFIQGILGRDPDYFGATARAAERMEQAKLEQNEEELRRRRGMFGYL